MTQDYGAFQTVTIHLPERFQREAAKKVSQEIISHLIEGNCQIIVDFSRVKCIDSSGLSALLEGRKKIIDSSTQIVLVNLSCDLRKLLEMTCLDQVFAIA